MLPALVLSIYVLSLPLAIFLLIMSQPKVVAKHEVGDIVAHKTVTYRRGRWAKHFGLAQTVRAIVEKVDVGYGGIPFSHPVYTVSWPSAWPEISPIGRACVGKGRLSDWSPRAVVAMNLCLLIGKIRF